VKATPVDELRDGVFILKRERILREAAALFYEHGYLQTTMDAIAERLGATKPFVYYHFDSKIDLLVEICERGTGEALAAIEEATQDPGSATQRFEAYVRALARMALKNHDFVAIYFREERNLPQKSIDKIRQMRKVINKRLRDLLEQGVASGDFELNDPGLGALMIAGMSSYAFAWFRERGRLNIEEATEEIVRASLKLVSRPDARASESAHRG